MANGNGQGKFGWDAELKAVRRVHHVLTSLATSPEAQLRVLEMVKQQLMGPAVLRLNVPHQDAAPAKSPDAA